VHELTAVVKIAGEVLHQRDRVIHPVMVSAIPTTPTRREPPRGRA
jgi:hypothetical protein